MTEAQILGLWQGAAVFLFSCLVIVAAVIKFGPQEPECSPDCNHCPAWRREQDAKRKADRQFAWCPICGRRHPPSESHR